MIDRILLKLDTLKQLRALRDSLETIDPDMMYMDTIMDDVDMDCVGYYGKEGESEYGEYTPSDEYKMWVGENGDTIWE